MVAFHVDFKNAYNSKIFLCNVMPKKHWPIVLMLYKGSANLRRYRVGICHLEEKKTFFGSAPKICSNFIVFQYFLIKIELRADLILIRSFPGSFFNLMSFSTPT